ncbi:MAG TPA: gliding motility-associated C-terminal domain-containing protein [Chitinophagales bacterium]|nr:gliding motility-associated C-terminal domain-containing protein [Chitinophagales bacterium]HRK28093.1 gliding motility-associated C-terminal domain-containing protein [Chitinophagales bacterium]
MKKLALLLILAFYSAYLSAQCSITLGGQNPPFFICLSQLPLQLAGSPPGGVFSPSAGVIGATFNPISPGSYPVTYTTPTGSACTQIVIVSAPSQTAQILQPATAFFCQNGAPVPLVGNLGANPAATFVVNGTPTNTFDPAVWGAGVHQIQYAYIDPANGCVSADNLIVNVLPTPDMAFTGLQNQYCLTDEPSALVATNFAPGQSTFSGTGVTALGTFDPALAGPGMHQITHSYTDFSGICSNSLTVSVEVSDINITPDFSSLGSICNFSATDTLIYSGTPIPAALSPAFNWLLLPDGNITYNGGDTIVVNWATQGSKNVTLTIAGVPCLNQPVSKTLEVSALNVSFTRLNPAACIGQNDTLIYTGAALPAGAILNWTVADGNILTADNASAVIQWNTSGSKTVSLSISGLPCSIPPVSQTIDVGAVLVTTIPNQTLEKGQEITLATTATGNGSLTYLWSQAATLSCSNCDSPIALPQQTTTYAVTATDQLGCTGTAQVTITVIDDRNIFVPNIFTPNGDGRNDQLFVLGNGIDVMEWTIYDRWGGKVYYATNLNDGWDGTLNGEALNSGVFVYTLQVTFFDGQTRLFTGNVTLAR